MTVEFIFHNKEFSLKQRSELKRFLAKLPRDHLRSINRIIRVQSLEGTIADSSPFEDGEEIRLSVIL